MALTKTYALDGDAGYGFEWLRIALELTLQEGVLGAGDFKATPAAAGGNRVDVAAGLALVKGDSGLPALGLSQGLYLQPNDGLIPNAVTFDPGGAQPRLDQVVLEVNDSTDLATAGSAPRIYVLKGAEVAGTTLDNAYTNGSAAALPANTIRLADRLAPAGTNTLVATDLRDRRKWARGAFRRIIRNANGAGTSNYTYSSGSLGAVDAVNLAPRIECSGVPLKVTLDGVTFHSAAAALDYLGVLIDGQGADGAGTSQFPWGQQETASASNVHRRHVEDHTTPAAGSRVITAVMALNTGGTMTISASATSPFKMVVSEDLRSSADNN